MSIRLNPTTGKLERLVMHADTVPAFDKRSEDRKVRERAIEAGTARRGYEDWNKTNTQHKRDSVNLFLDNYEVLADGSVVELHGSVIDSRVHTGSDTCKAKNKEAARLTRAHNHRTNRFGKIPDSPVRYLTREEFDAKWGRR